MSNIIQLLERLATDASLQNKAQQLHAIAEAELKQAEQQALVNGDTIELKKQLDVVPDIVAFLAPSKDESPEDDSQESDEEQKQDTEHKLAI